MDLSTAAILGITFGILVLIIYIEYNIITGKEKINDMKGYIKKTHSKKIVKKEDLDKRGKKLIVNENIKKGIYENTSIDDLDFESNFYDDIIYDREITSIDGIGINYANKLNKIGIVKITDLYTIVQEPDGIEKINESTGIYKKILEKWAIQADLLRIHGITDQQIKQLLSIDIQSTSDMAESSPDIIHKKLLESKLYSEIPSIGMLQRWIRLAIKIVTIDEKKKLRAQMRERAFTSLWK